MIFTGSNYFLTMLRLLSYCFPNRFKCISLVTFRLRARSNTRVAGFNCSNNEKPRSFISNRLEIQEAQHSAYNPFHSTLNISKR